jgi:hypothetical protein
MRIRKFSHRRAQTGVALLIAIFALLLLSAIGMGMMFSANTETSVNANYREKQIAVYASIAGAMEAKDRLTTAGDIPVPGGIPSTSAANVIYIINPSSSSDTVAPWDYNNKYYDTELCHDNVLGLTGTNGTQCPAASTSFPSGSAWYQTLDDSSSSYTGAFKFTTPLYYKWTRIQLKTNNATPYPADGVATNSNQVCWNGMAQIPIPSGYKVDCTPNGAVTKLTLTAGGSGYTSPTVTISAPPSGGTQATATATVCSSGCPLSGVVVDTPGVGYTSAPTVTIAPPASGTTATATATVVSSGSVVSSVTQNNLGSPTACWADANTPVTFGLQGGGGATITNAGTVALSGHSCIASLQFTGGSCASPAKGSTGVSVTPGGGSGFAGTVNVPNAHSGDMTGVVVAITNPGSGYTATSYSSTSTAITLGLSGCSGLTATATLGHTLASSSALTLTNGGAGYTSSPSVVFSPSTTLGNYPSITANLGGSSPGQVTAITLTNPGSGYTSAPAITITGGCGTGTPPPACTTNAVAHATFNGAVQSITITNGGSGYTAPPTITIGGGGTGATAVASISAGTYYAPVYLITSLGYSPGGARSMVQIEAAPAIRALSLPGALTLDGPSPSFGAPNSNNFNISGVDNVNGGASTAPAPAGCDTTASPSRPSIGVYDDPNNPTSPTSVSTVLSDIPSGRTTNYPGLNASPDVQNVYGALGDQGTTPSGMDTIVSSVSALPGANVYTGNQTDSSINLGSLSGSTPPVMTPAIDVVNGNLTFNGNNQGYGILVVTGVLTFKGNFTWNGIVLVVGQGDIEFSGGGNGTINGSVMVAKTKDSSGAELSALGQPTLNWSGGGGNGIYYDHCYADGLLSMIPMTVPASAKPLTILSIKTLAY